MARNDEKEAAREKEEKEAAAAREKEAKRRAAREVTVGETSVTGGLPAEDYLTEQEKNPGSDPVSPAVDPVPAEILDIPTKQPYPTGGGV